jgi:hypothetical protein
MKGFILAAAIATAALAAPQTVRAQVVVWPQPAPVVWAPVAPAPVMVAPVPVRRYYGRPVVVGHQRVPYVVTRNRPILGGSVSRGHDRYRPVMF